MEEEIMGWCKSNCLNLRVFLGILLGLIRETFLYIKLICKKNKYLLWIIN